MKIVMLGAPGAGKGTQADIIGRKFSIPAISTGNMLRDAIREETPIGVVAKGLIENGNLAPDEIVISIVSERLKAPDCQKGFVLDGMPRTILQAETLEKAGIVFDAVISLEIDDATIERRMVGRRTCEECGATYHVTANPPKIDSICDVCGNELTIRADDAPETVKERLRVYHEETEPLKDFYRAKGVLIEVPGDASVKEVSNSIIKALEMA